MHAFKKIRTSTSGLRKSPNKWTKEENQKLATLVASYGEKKWKRISAEMGGQKTGAQCAQHWKRVLSPEIRKGHWDENEEDLLLRLVVQYGSCWKKIAKKIPQRTDIQCRYQYLKAKQSREVMWDAKEDESLIKKVMEMANCNFFKIISDSGINNNNDINGANNRATSNNNRHFGIPDNTNSLSSNTNIPVNSPKSVKLINSITSPNKPNESDQCAELNNSSDVKEDDCDRMKISGECNREGGWADDSHDVNMSDSSGSNNEASIIKGDNACANCHSPTGSHINKVVWLEISEHMARLKLTSTLRTALECKSRFTELLGNKISFSAPNNFCHNHSTESNVGANIDHYGLKILGGAVGSGSGGGGGSGGVGDSGSSGNSGGGGGGGGSGRGGIGIAIVHPDSKNNDTNINIKINSNTLPSTTTTTASNITSNITSNNINITNCNNNNITINITNSYTTTTTANTNPNGINFQRTISHSTSSLPHPTASVKMERASSPMLAPSHPSKSSAPPILSPAPPFPSFTHLSHPSFPHIPQSTLLKPSVRNVPSGLESLAAVASILPREMLADYAQF
jgi:hypothetical protein